MRSLVQRAITSRGTSVLVAVGILGIAGAALGLPWDIDMADGQASKAYSRVMTPPPAGVVAQPNMTTPVIAPANHDRNTPEGQALTSPFPQDDKSLALGQKMYGIYCTPCHGDGQQLGTVAQPGRFPGVVPLSGAAGVAKLRTDGYLYLTIRNGGAVMPYYGWAMSDAEMWSIVQYVRTLPDAAYLKPAEEPTP